MKFTKFLVTYFKIRYGLEERSMSNQHSFPSLLPTIKLSPANKFPEHYKWHVQEKGFSFKKLLIDGWMSKFWSNGLTIHHHRGAALTTDFSKWDTVFLPFPPVLIITAIILFGAGKQGNSIPPNAIFDPCTTLTNVQQKIQQPILPNLPSVIDIHRKTP